MKFYIVTVNEKPSLIAYIHLRDAEAFIEARSRPEDYKNQTGLYKLFSMKDHKFYAIEEVTVLEEASK